MKTERKFAIYLNLFNNIVIASLFVLAGGLISSGTIDWTNFPASALVSIAVGLIVSTVIPVGKIGGAIAGKVSKPGTFLFNLIMYAVLLAIMLVFLCPTMTLFIACVLNGVPVGAVLSLQGLYGMFFWFLLIGLVFLLIFGGLLVKLAMKCAGMKPTEPGAEPDKPGAEKEEEKA